VHRERPRPLRRLLGAADEERRVVRGRRRDGAVLPGDGGVAGRGLPAEACGERLHRAAGDQGGTARHVRSAHGPRRVPRHVAEPIQGPPLRVREPGHHRPARLAGRLQPLQPQAATQ
jgi:hypothetical protein